MRETWTSRSASQEVQNHLGQMDDGVRMGCLVGKPLVKVAPAMRINGVLFVHLPTRLTQLLKKSYRVGRKAHFKESSGTQSIFDEELHMFSFSSSSAPFHVVLFPSD